MISIQATNIETFMNERGRSLRGGLSIQGQTFPNEESDSIDKRTQMLLGELYNRKCSLMEKQIREKQRHTRRGRNTSPPKSLAMGLSSESVVSSLSIASPGRSIVSITSPDRGSIAASASVMSLGNTTKKYSSKTESLRDDQNMSLFSSSTHIYIKHPTATPLMKPLKKCVPVIFPHYEPKKKRTSMQSKKMQAKLAEVLLNSQVYGKVERPYLFSLLRQSGGLDLPPSMTAAALIDQANARNASHSAGTLSSSAYNPSGEYDDIFQYMPTEVKARAPVQRSVADTPPVPVKLQVLPDDSLEQMLGAIDQERLQRQMGKE